MYRWTCEVQGRVVSTVAKVVTLIRFARQHLDLRSSPCWLDCAFLSDLLQLVSDWASSLIFSQPALSYVFPRLARVPRPLAIGNDGVVQGGADISFENEDGAVGVYRNLQPSNLAFCRSCGSKREPSHI